MRFDGQVAFDKEPKWLAILILVLWALIGNACAAVVSSPPAPVIAFIDSGAVLVTWDANNEPDLAGYNVYWGLTSRNVPPGFYSDKQDVGDVTSFEISGLLQGSTYYFAITAYDTAANESGFSQEVAFTLANKKPHAPVEFAINGADARGDTIVVKPSNGLVISWTDEPMYADSTALDPDLITEWRIYIDNLGGVPENRTIIGGIDNEIQISLLNGLYKIYMSSILQDIESDISASRIFEFRSFERIAHTLTLRIVKVQP